MNFEFCKPSFKGSFMLRAQTAQFLFNRLVAFTLIAGLCGCKQAENGHAAFSRLAVEVDVIEVIPKTLPADLEYTGTIASYHQMEVRSRVEGVLTSIDFIEGQPVNKGDVLFHIDPAPFQAALNNSKGELAAEESVLWNAQRAVERIKPIYEQKAASRKDYEDAVSALKTAEARVSSAMARLEQAEQNLSYTTISAPIKGLSGESTYGSGALITPGSSKYLMKISDIESVYVNFHISESELLKQRREIAQGSLDIPDSKKYTVELTLADGTVYPYRGKLDYAEPTFRPETGTRMMRALVPNPDEFLRPGQFVRVHLFGATWPNAIAIPQRAVLQGSKGMFVYLAGDGKATSQPIKAGEWYRDDWIITSGLKAGDLVITSNVDKLEPQTPITIVSPVTTPN